MFPVIFRSVLIAIFLLITCTCSTSPQTSEPTSISNEADNIPATLLPFIDRMNTPIVLKELPDYILGDLPLQITKAQALEDIDILTIYLITLTVGDTIGSNMV